jgi:membrane-associated protease RseP (regulator of RpoE activity)
MSRSSAIRALLLVEAIALVAPAHAADDGVAVPRLGLVVVDVTPTLAQAAGLDQVKGCMVQLVAAGSPAATAEIQVGDIIVSLNNRGIRDARELEKDIAGIDPGEVVRMCVVRDDYRTTIYVAPGEERRQEAKVPGWLGVEVSNVGEGSLESFRLEEAGKEGGVLVERVQAGSPAESVGMERGDVIMSFNSRKVRTVKELVTDVAGAAPGDKVRICIMRGAIRKTLYPVLGRRPIAPLALTGAEGPEQERRLPTRSQLAQLFPDAQRFERELQPVPHYRAYRSAEYLGVAFVTTEVCPEASQGYQGAISTLVGVSVAGKIVGALILDHTESVKYTRDHLEQFIKQYENRDATGPFVLGRDVDAITGATVTSSAINHSVVVGIAIVVPVALNITPPASSDDPDWSQVVWDGNVILLLAVAALALVGYFRGSQTIRFLVLGMTLAYLGWLKGGGLSVHDAINIVEGDLPLLSANVHWYTLVVLVALTSILIGRFYCGWLCPFGALTEMLYRARSCWRIKVPPHADLWLRPLKYIILLVIMLSVIFVGQSHLTSAMVEIVEPFGTLFKLVGGTLAWVMAGLFLIGSIFVSRFYCRYFCPLGAFFALVTVGVSFVNRELFKVVLAARHHGSSPAAGGCPMNAVRHERHGLELGIRSGECIACTSRTPPSSRPRGPFSAVL